METVQSNQEEQAQLPTTIQTQSKVFYGIALSIFIGIFSCMIYYILTKPPAQSPYAPSFLKTPQIITSYTPTQGVGQTEAQQVQDVSVDAPDADIQNIEKDLKDL